MSEAMIHTIEFFAWVFLFYMVIGFGMCFLIRQEIIELTRTVVEEEIIEDRETSEEIKGDENLINFIFYLTLFLIVFCAAVTWPYGLLAILHR